MTKNPLLNALAAGLYVALIVTLITSFADTVPEEDTVFIPMAMLSLFTLSAGVMGYLFLYEPLALFFAGDRVRAVRLFLATLGFFALITLCFIALMMWV